MPDFLDRHWADPGVHADVLGLRSQFLLEKDEEKAPSPDAWREDSETALRSSTLAYINWLMDNDSKCTPLKSLQGKIWKEGYAGGELKSEVYPDVAPAFIRWKDQKKIISIFSSGSVQAQQLLFANTTGGDLTPLIRGYFDTTIGPKRDAESYKKIASGLGFSPGNILFVSDTVEELNAARQAGMETALCARGNAMAKADYKVICTFHDLGF